MAARTSPWHAGHVAHEIRPEMVHSTLVRVAGDGQALDTAARAARAAADTLKGAFGTAVEAASAFAGFWSARTDTGEGISALVLHQATCVAEAADAFIDSDGVMTDDARSAMGSMQ
jgi:hypothetical protein